MTDSIVSRRGLMTGTAAGIIVAPALLASRRQAAAEEAAKGMAAEGTTATSMGEGIRALKLGAFRITVIREGRSVFETEGDTALAEELMAAMTRQHR